MQYTGHEGADAEWADARTASLCLVEQPAGRLRSAAFANHWAEECLGAVLGQCRRAGRSAADDLGALSGSPALAHGGFRRAEDSSSYHDSKFIRLN